MALKMIPFDLAKHLHSAELQADYLDAAFSTGDDAVITHALGVVAKARGMTAIARDAGVQRAHLYRALSAQGRPELATILKVVQSLGLRLTVVPAPVDPAPAELAPVEPADA